MLQEVLLQEMRGQALGAEIFMMTGSTLVFDSASDITIPHAIESNQGDQTGITSPTTFTLGTAPNFTDRNIGGLSKTRNRNTDSYWCK